MLDIKYKISVSIVIYNQNYTDLDSLLNKLSSSDLIEKVFVVDNSKYINEKLLQRTDIQYISPGKNLGYGRGHNIALKEILQKSEYHLIINADVDLEDDVIDFAYKYMNENQDVSMFVPKAYYDDGVTQQYNCKLIPRPIDLFARKVLPIKACHNKINYNYDLIFTGNNKIMEVPVVMGYFMFIRTKVLEKTGLFDERFFLYLEDIDLSRRISSVGKIIYNPNVFIKHKCYNGSKKHPYLFFVHFISAFKYFCKWGWIFDKQRKRVNVLILKSRNKYKN